MRLIDADAMNEELFYKQLGGKETLITAECAFNMIKCQPTVNKSVKGDLISRADVVSIIKSEIALNLGAYTDVALCSIRGKVKQLPTACNDGWIPCSERLPEEYGEYFVVWKDNASEKSYIEISEYSDLEGWIGNIPQAGLLGYEITYWQPLPSLPQPYKEDEKC